MLAASAGLALAPAAFGQDSVGTLGGITGHDALSAYQVTGTSLQVRNYAVDMPVVTSSWGNQFYLGPVAKSSASLSTGIFTNHLIATTVASNRLSAIAPFTRTAYTEWFNAGQGVNPSRNSSTTTQAGTTDLQGHTFGLAMLEFGGGTNQTFGDGDDESNVVAATVSFTPRQNGRAWVSRIVAATNRASAGAGLISNSSLGLGGVDESANVALLADAYGAGASDPLTTKRYYRVAGLSRATNLVNSLANTAAGDASATRSLLSTTVTLTTPTLIPTSIATRPVVIALDMANALRFEQVANTTLVSATSHLTAGSSARGPMAFSALAFSRLSNGAADAGTGAALSRGPSSTKTRSLSAWGVNTDGSPDLTAFGLVRADLPTDAAQIIDPEDGFSPGVVHGGLGNHEFMNYQSQVCFRGGNGPVALSVLPGSGDLLMAAGVAATGGGAGVPQSQDNYLAVARVNAGTGAVTWTIAAHTGSSSGAGSKAIWSDTDGDRLPDTVIGRIARYSEVFPSATNGPSISAPGMDRFGNLYFIATVELFGSPQSTRESALIKANFDAATNTYQLEKILDVNQTFTGLNSQRSYQVQLLSPADSDSVDSGATWHSSVVQGLNAVVNPGTLGYGQPFSLGALVFRTKVVYDWDQNATYLDPAMPGGSGSDQAYNVMMALIPKVLGADVAQVGGAAGPDGQLTVDDLIEFVNSFSAGDPLSDVAAIGGAPYPDGQNTVDDLIFFVNAFSEGS